MKRSTQGRITCAKRRVFIGNRLLNRLRRLQLAGEVEYSLTQRSFHVTLLKGLSPTELEDTCVKLHARLARAESSEAAKVKSCDGIGSVSTVLQVGRFNIRRQISNKKNSIQ